LAKIELRGITKIFGPDPGEALKRLKAGANRDELLAKSGHTVALRDVTLSVEEGEIFVVMGLSGSGKSTLIRHINRLIDPTEGRVTVDVTDVTALSIAKLIEYRRDNLSMVFQHFALLPHRTVLDNVAYGLELQKVPRARRREEAQKWIDAVGLQGFEAQYPSQLSGGMQQRVGLARALCVDHDILLMDEAFSALDPLIRSQMQDLLMELQSRLNKTIVFITHDLDEALRLGDHIAILRDGEVVQVGAPAEILLHPADDYVRTFVKDVNRSRVLTVATVMQPPPLRISDETLERALAEMRRAGAEYGYVVTGGDYRGVVTEAGLRALGDDDGRHGVAEAIERAPTVSPSTTLAEALPRALASAYPVPVVDADGALRGVISADTLSEALRPDDDGGAAAGAAETPSTPAN
jgi:glycine betaine/proline transport system ATP-binding protein